MNYNMKNIYEQCDKTVQIQTQLINDSKKQKQKKSSHCKKTTANVWSTHNQSRQIHDCHHVS